MTGFIRKALYALYGLNIAGTIISAAMWLGGPEDGHASTVLVYFIGGAVGCLATLGALTLAEARGL